MSTEASMNEQTVAAAAELVLAKLGLSLEDAARLAQPKTMPTFAEYAPEVAKSTPKTSSKTWTYYWDVLVAEWDDRPIDEPRATEINALANLVQERAAAKPQSSTGAGARSLFIDAVKCFYRRAGGVVGRRGRRHQRVKPLRRRRLCDLPDRNRRGRRDQPARRGNSCAQLRVVSSRQVVPSRGGAASMVASWASTAAGGVQQ